MKAAAHLNMTPEETSIRRRELLQSLEPFAQMLTHIYKFMPHPGFKITDAGFEPLPPKPEWQDQIDKVINMRNEHIKVNFPEFYTEKD